jgi:hypothetical protein
VRCLHSNVRTLSLSSTLLEVDFLWFLASCGVSGTAHSSKFVMRCCSSWSTSSSCATCCGTQYLAFTSMTIIELSSLLTISFTSSFSTSNCSFSCCSCAFSSSNFTWREIFSHSIALCISTNTPCTCVKSQVACAGSSYACRRRASTVSTKRWS